MQPDYQAQDIERDAQDYWDTHQSFRAAEDPAREKFYCLCMFPYPSGRLHMGHVRNYTIGDVISRWQRMNGRNVMQPMGFDAFGLPAENAAIDQGVPPARWTRGNIEHMRGQLQRLGFGYDWSRELATCDPGYYRWQQWFFLQLHDKGLVERRSSRVNWDPVDQTVLANEQVIDGRGWRSGAVVEQREIPQWFLRITAYAQELLDDLDNLPEWPEAVRTMQRNWIGRSEGVEIDFPLADGSGAVTVFTTRPDTLFGATYLAVAAEHPLTHAAGQRCPAIRAFIEDCGRSGVSEVTIEMQEKRGVALGIEVTHPLTGEHIPVWAANFVLMGYGAGAVMAVPGHDHRDWDFARAHDLPIISVIGDAQGPADITEAAFVEHGVLHGSGAFDGLDFDGAFDAIAAALEKKGQGRRRVNWRLRDWGVSRQRYWGCPIPMIHCDACGIVPVPEDRLPVTLPEDLVPDGKASPLGAHPDFQRVDCPKCGKEARRETDTFDTFVDSSWYFARFACPELDSAMLDERAAYWLPVDQYIGGIEHAILHLLYARFFTKAMRDCGLVDADEPFGRLLSQGMVLKDGAKMSKSRGNTVDPESILDAHGADAVRLFMMFASPPEQTLEWSEAGIDGMHRFLKRLWRLVHGHLEGDTPPALQVDRLGDVQRAMRRKVHGTLHKMTDDIGRRHAYNTAIAAAMELVNALYKFDDDSPAGRAVMREALDLLVAALSPIVPHVTHALWSALGHPGAVIDAPWPAVDESALTAEQVTIVVQVNGKLRGRIEVAADADREAVAEAAVADPAVQKFIDGQPVKKRIVVPGKLVNLVV